MRKEHHISRFEHLTLGSAWYPLFGFFDFFYFSFFWRGGGIRDPFWESKISGLYPRAVSLSIDLASVWIFGSAIDRNESKRPVIER